VTQVPADRYGRRTSVSTRLLVVLAGMVGIGLIGWYLWTILWAIDPKVTSTLGTHQDLTQQTSATFDYSVKIKDGVNVADVRCTVSAQAKDHSTVGGPAVITPSTNGRNTYRLPTSRKAVFILWDGCTAPGQTNPR